MNNAETIRNYRDIMRKDAENSPYERGFHNGLELALAHVEKREPVYVETGDIQTTTVQTLGELINMLQQGKPGDRSERDRRFAVVITELEKARAIAQVFLGQG
jgi:hypothetical protein